jgi:hypothetical protein
MAEPKPSKKSKSSKTEVVAFKVEEDLADFLNKLPNKSEYIRRAIIAQFGMACPLCTGTGVVPRGIHNHYQPIIQQNKELICHLCHKPEEVPLALEAAPVEERKRLEQFFHGGPFYCRKCYPSVPSCDDCGWHIPHEEAADHMRKNHAIR